MTTIWSQEKYLLAWQFATRAHVGQLVPGTDLPYVFHVGAVAMEVIAALAQGSHVDDPDLAVQCALLHDVIEDTAFSYECVQEHFGIAVAQGVQALSKDKRLPTKTEQMADSLRRIQQQPREIWMVKLADRIVNLQPPPPLWSVQKIDIYRQEAVHIWEVLSPADGYLAQRLRAKIEIYPRG
jgi:(p)ppGpp synthase/HD superfamily hydrolase